MTSTNRPKDSFTHGLRGVDENLPLEQQHGIYAAIDPQVHFDAQTFRDEVVLITGASKGIGAEIALHFAKGGAALALVSRSQSTLDETQSSILKEVPDTQVLTIATDVVDWKACEETVGAVVKRFGKLSILVANAGTTTKLSTPIAEKDPEGWWQTFEVNVRGVFNFVRPGLPHLKESGGYVIAISSGGAQVRMLGSSDYNMSKHALNRFIEFIALENPEVKAFAVHPGRIKTALGDAAGLGPDFAYPDTPELPAATLLYLAAGNADWLSGRYVSCNWDLQKVEKDFKAKILEKDALVNKLSIP